MTGPTLTNGGLILLLGAIVLGSLLYKRARRQDNNPKVQCRECYEELDKYASVDFCSEYCQQRWYREHPIGRSSR